MKEVNPQQARQHIEKGALLLDVREDDEWNAGHIEGALHIPLGELPARLNEVPRDREIFCLCRSGRRSAKAQGIISAGAPGTAVTNVSGGIVQWVKDGFPILGKVLE
jgi:rhodanese-related sulfurtransferase